MSFDIRQVNCADAVINNLDTLLTMAVYLLGLKHIDALHELPDDFCIQFTDVGILPHQCKEVVGVQALFLCIIKEPLQFFHPALKLGLFRLIVPGQLGEAVIGNLTFHIILVNALDERVQLGDTGLGLLVLLPAIPKFPVKGLFGIAGHQTEKFILMVSGIC